MTDPRPSAHASTDAAAVPPEQPLLGLVAVEIGHSVAAPFAGQILASLGARLVKIEAPGHGDEARRWGPPFWEGAAATFQALNRDKESATVDLKNPAERDRLLRFIREEADIVVQNLRPGLVEEFGIDARVRDDAPGLIYCNLGAFGRTGPFARRPGYDPLMQAFGGIMSVTGEEGRAPVRVGPSIIDMATGMWSVIGILAAVHRRTLTGEGCVVDTSLFETALGWMTVPSAQYLASGEVPRRIGSEAAMVAPYKAFRTSDGYLIIAAGNDKLFAGLCQAIGKPELTEDPRFIGNPKRVENRVVLNEIVEERVATRTRAEWIAALEAVGVPCAPLQDTAEVLAHPQTVALGMLQSLPDAALRLMGLPVSFAGRRPPLRRLPPAYGQDDDALGPLDAPADAE